jgi:Uma2 family endonuclease
MLFVIDPVRDLKRRPDVAYVSFDRWPCGRRIPRAPAWEVVPDLAVEVVSPTNTAEEVLAKVHEYFQADVRRVWVIYPSTDQIYDYDSPTSVRIVARAEELDGGDVLPDFRLPLATLFEDEDQPE